MTRLEKYIIENNKTSPLFDLYRAKKLVDDKSSEQRRHIVSSALTNDNEAPIHLYLKQMQSQT